MEAADKIKDDYMKSFALKIIRNNFAELARSNRIKKLPKELLIDILVDLSYLFPIKPPSPVVTLHTLSLPANSSQKVMSTPSSPSTNSHLSAISPSTSPNQTHSHSQSLILHNIFNSLINDNESKN